MPVHSDAKLVQSARSGDEKAFETLVEKNRVRIYTTISGFIDNPQDREDIAQETFINAYRNLHQLSKPERFGSWLDTIAQNQCRDWMRKNRVQTVPIDEVEENLPSSDDSPEHRSVEAEQHRIIAQAIDTLPQTERQIAREHYLEDASHDELVSRHGISYQSVSARLFRAKRKLVKRLRHLLGGILVPPTTALNKISSGGFTAMKIGTVPKITVGVIIFIALAFIGSRKLLSPEEDSSPSVAATVSKPGKSEQTSAEISTSLKRVVTAPRRADESQISAEEMVEIEDFFAQLDEVDTRSDIEQLTTTESQQVNDERVADNPDGFAENAEQSAEDVMNAYVEAFKHLDFEAMQPLLTADMRNRWDSAPTGFRAEIGKVRRETADGTMVVEDPEMVEEARLQLERLMFEPMLKMMSRAAVVDSGYVDDEFHFRLSVPPPDAPISNGVAVIEGSIPPPPDGLIKMRIEDGAWRIYDSETLD